MSHLSTHARQVLNATELEFKELQLNVLMTAFAARKGREDLDASITKEVPGIAKHMANQLIANKFVLIYDPVDMRNYYVKAVADDLVAVYHAMHAAFDMYVIVASSPRALGILGVESTTFNDIKLIDKIFGFKADDAQKVELPAAQVQPQGGNVHNWDWFVVQPPAPEKEDKEKDKAKAKAEVVKPAIKVKPPKPQVPSVGRPGQPIPVTRERLQEAGEAGGPGSQIGQALVNASQQGGNRQGNRQRDRQQHRDHPDHDLIEGGSRS